MINRLTKFCKDTSAAVTVDWVVLTAAVVGLAIAAIGSVLTGATDMGDNIGTFLTTQEPFLQNAGSGDD